MGGVESEWLQRLVRFVAFTVGLPWLISWWGAGGAWRMFRHFVVEGQGFELDYRAVLLDCQPRSVLHVGANVGQEAALYTEMGVPFVFWIECQEECRAPLRANLAKAQRSQDLVAIEAMSSTTGAEAAIHRVDNSISTSLKPMGTGHLQSFPFLRQLAPTPTTTITADDLIDQETSSGRLSAEHLNFEMLYLDVQGSELDVLRGATNTLKGLKVIMTEVSSSEHYKDGTLEAELHSFLVSAGFERTMRCVLPIGHGNALYVRR